MVSRKILLLLFTAMFCCVNAQNNSNNGVVKEEIRQILEQFCNEQYNNCYSSKRYLIGSLVVDTYSVENKAVSVSGFHSYEGEELPFVGRKKHLKVKFRAVIHVGADFANVRFLRWSEPDIVDYKGHWEGCGFRFVNRKISYTLQLMVKVN